MSIDYVMHRAGRRIKASVSMDKGVALIRGSGPDSPILAPVGASSLLGVTVLAVEVSRFIGMAESPSVVEVASGLGPAETAAPDDRLSIGVASKFILAPPGEDAVAIVEAPVLAGDSFILARLISPSAMQLPAFGIVRHVVTAGEALANSFNVVFGFDPAPVILQRFIDAGGGVWTSAPWNVSFSVSPGILTVTSANPNPIAEGDAAHIVAADGSI